jgi:hypothetical protein
MQVVGIEHKILEGSKAANKLKQRVDEIVKYLDVI